MIERKLRPAPLPAFSSWEARMKKSICADENIPARIKKLIS
jgi:hypothetical protein